MNLSRSSGGKEAAVMQKKTYIAIDLKSFYASVECVERGKDPMTTCLVVADPSRTEKTICLAVSPALKAYGIEAEHDYVVKVVGLIKERATFVADFWTIAPYLFVAPSDYVEKDLRKFGTPENWAMAHEAITSGEDLESYIRGREWPMGKVMNCIRLALTGSGSGLGIHEIISCIGTQEAVRRVEVLGGIINA